jgi:hypothetical protein|tara:strand:- start:520 stop:1551 length:1032 start_codon:yes stop_codon:yes gene_type:complete
MAISNTFDPNAPQAVTGTGSAISNREDLLDVLTILAPEETPVLSSLNKQGASSTFVEWTVDSLSAPSSDGISEGADVTAFDDKFAGRARLGNYVQKFRRSYLVSDLQEAVDSVGPAKVAQAEAKAIRELKRDIEKTLCSNNDRQAETGSVPYKMRGLGKWLANASFTTTSDGAIAAASDVPSDFRTPDTSAVDVAGEFTENELNGIITSIFKETGTTNNLTLIADTALRTDIADFARIQDTGNSVMRRVMMENGEAEIKQTVDLYQSDHGIVSIVNANPDCMPDTTPANIQGYVLNPEYAGIHELIPMGSTRLPNLGGGERGFVDCALTLGVYHPAAHGKIMS